MTLLCRMTLRNKDSPFQFNHAHKRREVSEMWNLANKFIQIRTYVNGMCGGVFIGVL